MNTTELIAQVRKDVFIGDTVFPDYDDAAILLELNRVLRTTFERAIVQSRQGYWQKFAYFDVIPGRSYYRIPARAIAGGLEQVALSNDGRFYKLSEVTETHAQDYELAIGASAQVQKYVVRSDWVELLPTPSSAYTLRMTYYLRPSTLVAPTTAGYIVASDGFDPSPFLQVNVRPTSLPFGDGLNFDVVHPGGWNEVTYAELQDIGGGLDDTLFNLDPTLVADGYIDVGRISVDGSGSAVLRGDVIRKAGESEWPCLPDDYHSTLAKLTAVNIMTQLNMLEKKSVTEVTAAMEFERFVDMLKSRVKTEAEVLKAPRSVLQVGRGQRSFGGWR